MLVDTHCHLDPQYLPEGPDGVLARARAAGVYGFVTIGVGHDAGAAREAVALAEKLPECVAATAGVHPHDAGTMTPTIYEEIAALAARREVVAVGEVGLDYHYDNSPRDVQREVFARFVGLAKELGKPLVIHTREAAADTLEVLEREGARKVGGIIHCFSEDRAFAERALAMGFYLSFSGIVTFKSAQSVHDVAAWAPADRILVETDSPYLAPVPLRGKPCEPAYLVHTAKRVAELRSVSLEELTRLTTANASRVFGRAFPTA
jgi:TatD DNase family protein